MMQAPTSIRLPYSSTTTPLARLLSAASAYPSISTGKERDTESGNDYFGARYYSSSMGRFMSPDWSSSPTGVPYADLGNPHSLNLYGYMRNNPLSGVDKDGHCGDDDDLACDSLRGSPFEGITHHLGSAARGFSKWAYNALFSGTIHNPFLPSRALLTIPALQPSNAGEAQGMNVAPLVVAGFGGTISITASAPAMIETTTAALTETIPLAGPTLTGFSNGETSMIQTSLGALQGAGYDTSPLSVLIRADMPSGYSAMSLSGSPTGAALGDGAFASQDMLNHTLEEELLHVNQNLQSQSFGPGDAAAKEAEVEATRKFPAPQ